MIRLGLLGGTFDPPHYGHLVLAQEAAWQLDLERVLFVPAQQNPLKRADEHVSSAAEARCAMVELAIQDNPRFALSYLDLERPPPSYSADLLTAIAADDRELFWLAGGDILPDLPRWHRPREVLRLARLVVARRPGAPEPDLGALEAALPGADVRQRVHILPMPGLAISGRDLRARVASDRPIRYLTPAAVEHYIRTHGLYGPPV